MPFTKRKLRVFLCHSSADKAIVQELYQRLNADGWIDTWLDKEKLLPGQNWDLEINKAVEDSDVVIVCLSRNSVTKEGYVQRELKSVLDKAEDKPEGTIFIIPLILEKLDGLEIPRRLRPYQYVDYFPKKQQEIAFKRLLASLRMRLELKGDVLIVYPDSKSFFRWKNYRSWPKQIWSSIMQPYGKIGILVGVFTIPFALILFFISPLLSYISGIFVSFLVVRRENNLNEKEKEFAGTMASMIVGLFQSSASFILILSLVMSFPEAFSAWEWYLILLETLFLLLFPVWGVSSAVSGANFYFERRNKKK